MAPKNNKNASKAEAPMSEFVQFRCTMSQKNHWIKTSRDAGKTLTDWIKDKLNKI